MRENSAPVVNSAPTTPGSMKLGLSLLLQEYINNLPNPIWISVAVDVILQEQENPDFIEPGVACCRGRVTTGAEFSRIYGTLLTKSNYFF